MRKNVWFVVALCSCGFVSCGTAQELTYPLVATGQVLCYDINGEVIDAPQQGEELFGQDGNYQAGLPMLYKDNGDGTVTDLNTGLTWEQTPNGGPVTWAEAQQYCEQLSLGGYGDWRLPTLKELFSISDFSAGWPYLDTNYFHLTTQGRVDKDEQYWAQEKYVGETVEGRNNAAFGVNHATGHIKAYPAGASLEQQGEGGRGNMPRPQGADTSRMSRQGPGGQGMQAQGPPTSGGRENMNQAGGPQAGGPPRGEGRDSLAMANGRQAQGPPTSGGRENMNQAGGPPQMGGPQNQAGGPQMDGAQAGGPQMMGNPMQKRVRAVRGDVYGENNYVDNGDGTITDKATGLMWAQSDNGKGIEWGEAMQYAESSQLAGYSDWRLPNVKELQSIVDYAYSPSSNDFKPAIDPMFNSTPIKNEAGDDDFGYCWTSTSALFRKGSPFYFAWYVAFGRAVNNQGNDMHGAGAVRFDSKSDNGMAVEGGEERYYNFVRLVREP
ncbi:MAG: DUF1566 domain-containing protein [Rikenellaceae bacterium]